MKHFLPFFLISFAYIIKAQNIGINSTGAAANSSAGLDVDFTNKGLLIPRMTAAQIAAIASPATGLLAYQTNGITGFYYYTGTAWVPLFGWSILGNSGTTAATHFLGTTDAVDLVLKTNASEAMRLFSNGNVSISSSTDAGYKLNVPNTGSSGTARFVGKVLVESCNNNSPFVLTNGDSYDIKLMANYTNMYGIGVNGSALLFGGIYASVGVNKSVTSKGIPANSLILSGGANSNISITDYIGNELVSAQVLSSSLSKLILNGGMSVGTDQPAYNFAINGAIGTGTGTTGDIIFSSGNSQAAGTTAHTLTNRWWIKGNTGILTNTSTPNASASLEIASTNSGVLIPRVALTAINAAGPITSPATSLLVYNTATAGASPNNVLPGYYYWDGTKWVAMSGAGSKNWALLGNSGTTDGTDFIGTTDNIPFNIRVNNQKAGRIDNTLTNAFFGYQAGNANTTGSGNTAIGQGALLSNTGGFSNVAIGLNAMSLGSGGYENIAIGVDALKSNTTGGDNTAIGKSAMFSNTTGVENTAIGYLALYTNNGGRNVAVGQQALRFNTTGYANTGIGWGSLETNSTGQLSVAFGFSALNQATGSYNTALGALALQATSTGQYNAATGYSALYGNTTGNANVANGLGAMYLNTTGSYNVAAGYNALYNNTTANNNTAVGSNALYTNTTGDVNVGLGYYALYNNTTGYGNTALGAQSMQSNTTASENTAMGLQSLLNNTTGANNTSVGSRAMSANITGGVNVAVGAGALGSNTTGSGNTALGYANLTINTTGTYNTSAGYAAMGANTTGYYNVANGSVALSHNTTGAGNTAIGYGSLDANTTADNNTAVGIWALHTNATGATNVAIGSNALLYNTTGNNNSSLGANSLFNNTTGANNTSFGFSSLYGSTTGANNIAIGYQSGDNITTGSNNLILGYNIDAPAAAGSNQMSIANLIFATGLDGTGTTVSTGNIGIGTNAPAERLEVCGNIKTFGNINASGTINASQAITCSSDMRFKKDIAPIKGSLASILKLQGVTYNWRTDEFKNRGFTDNPQIGFIAQELEKTYPELVQTDKDGYKSVDYSRLTPVLVEAIKEQNQQLKDQQQQIIALKMENDQLKNMNMMNMNMMRSEMEAIKQKIGLPATPIMPGQGGQMPGMPGQMNMGGMPGHLPTQIGPPVNSTTTAPSPQKKNNDKTKSKK